MDRMTSIFKALSDRNRLRAVSALMQYDELCACQITELLQVTGATASRHMGVLISAGLVRSRKDGRWVNYRLIREDPALSRIVEWIGDSLGEDETAAKDRARLNHITACDREALCRKQKRR